MFYWEFLIEQINIRSVVTVIKDHAKGDSVTEIRVDQKEILIKRPPKDD